jgi:hydroxyacylglutathione hydrolase
MPNRIQVSGIPAFKDNYIWVIHDDRHAVVVDPGDATPVLRFLQDQGLALAAILVTHHHADHVDGLSQLLARAAVPVFGPRNEDIDEITHPVGEPDRITLPHLHVTMGVIDVPGHTAGHIAYYGEGRLFCGDTLFACGCGRIFEGTPAQMFNSLDKLAALPENTSVYCAHEYTLSNIAFAQAVEPDNLQLQERAIAAAETRRQGKPTVPSTLQLEKATNPFLRSRIPAIAHAVESHTGTHPADTIAVFAALRQWKNTF